MNWHVELNGSSIKELSRLPRDRRERIELAIDEMENDPMAGDVKALKGTEWRGYFRKRVGNYRIIFSINRTLMRVDISAISIRSEKTYR